MKTLYFLGIWLSIYLIPVNLIAQSTSTNDTTIVLNTIILTDGTKIWGTLQQEDSAQLTVYDFNIGEIKISKNNIKNEDRQKLESSVIIETINNASYFGKIIKANPKSLVIQSTLIDTFSIESNTITKITLSDSYVSKRGGNWFSNPNATRYFFAPSAIPLKKKEGYFQNAYLLANSVNVGVTNNISVGGGVVIPLLFYVTPKISCQIGKNLYAGGGILFTQSFISTFNLSAGIGYGLFTVGNNEHNLTVGSGYGFAKMENDYKNTSMPIITINGMSRIGKRLSLVTENWLIPRARYNIEQTAYDPSGMPYTEMIEVKKNYYTLAGSLGLRFMPSIKTSIDFSMVGIQASPNTNFLALPYLDFVYKFN